jgi:hypothetical protein
MPIAPQFHKSSNGNLSKKAARRRLIAPAGEPAETFDGRAEFFELSAFRRDVLNLPDEYKYRGF